MKKQKGKFRMMVILLLIATFAAGMLAAFLGMYAFNSRAALVMGRWMQDRIYLEEDAATFAVGEVMPAVVSIRVVDDSAKGKKNISGGTGFIFDQTGLVVTNKHLIQRDKSKAAYEVVFSNSDEYQAVLVDQDPFEDVAILKIVTDEFKNDFPVVKLGNSEELMLGQKVFAIGNTLVTYDHSVVSGIVSALNRNVSAYYYDFGGPTENLAGLIQIDASINSGNSGGPLFNLNGEVVGMVTALEDAAFGIGFAIPIDDLKQALIEVRKNGEIERAAMGVRFVMLSKNEAADLDEGLEYGALLVGDTIGIKDAVSKKSNVYKAGLREGDVILEINNGVIDLNYPLNKAIKNYQSGEEVLVKFWRAGKIREVKVVLNSSKDFEQK
jgi:S1-C subfamily serine protease